MANAFDQFDQSQGQENPFSQFDISRGTQSDAAQQPQVQQPVSVSSTQSHPSIIEDLISSTKAKTEPVLAAGSNMLGDILGGLKAIYAASTGQDAQTAIDQVKKAISIAPHSPEGKLTTLILGKLLEPSSQAMQKVQQNLGEALYQASGPVGGAIGQALPTALGLAIGAGGARGLPKDIAPVETPIAAARPGEFIPPKTDLTFPEGGLSTEQRIIEKLKSGSDDAETAPYSLEYPKGKFSLSKEPKLVEYPPAVEAIRQGFDKGVISKIKNADQADKTAGLKMVNIMERLRDPSKYNVEYSALNRPSDIAGQLIVKNINFIKKINENAASQLDKVAKSLKGQSLDIAPVKEGFRSQLEDMGISIGEKGNLNFTGSDIEGRQTKPLQRILQDIYNRVETVNGPYDLHRLKRYIDNQVSYGKTASGLSGNTERVIKNLRSNADGLLDSNFENYNKINTTYSDTRNALDDLQNTAGKKIDITGANADKALGVLTRRIFSNVTSRQELLNAMTSLKNTANKYGANFKGNIVNQALIADELDAMFRPAARTSLQGQMEQVAGRALKSIKSPKEAVTGAAISAAGKLRGINQENAFKAIKQVLKGS